MSPRNTATSRLRDRIEPFLAEWAERGVSEPWAQFRNWAVDQILWDNSLSKEEIEDITRIDGARDKGIDAWYIGTREPKSILTLVQSKDQPISREDLAKMAEGFRDLFSENRPQSSNKAIREKAAELRSAFPLDLEIEFYLATSTVAPQGLTGKPDGTPNWEDTISVMEYSFPARFYVRDIKQLVEGIQTVHPTSIEAEFTLDTTNYFEFKAGGHTRVVSAAIRADELAVLYQKHRINLFRKNPRYYLGTRRAANQKIVKALTEGANETFFICNNGLTAIGSPVKLLGGDRPGEAKPGEAKKVNVQDFQIVNGCQTTASIHEVWRGVNGGRILRNVRVPIKIIEQPPASDLATSIAESTNTQTAIAPEDWKANDKRQENLFKEFRDNVSPPWFYEHKRGVWISEFPRAADKKPFKDGEHGYRHVGMKDLAQSCYSFLGHPAEAKDRASSIFVDEDKYELVFPTTATAVQLLLPHVIYLFADQWAKRLHNETDNPVDMLRFPMVYCVSRILHSLAGRQELGYLDPDESQQLLESKDDWLKMVFDEVFDELVEELVAVSAQSGKGPRSTVRTKTWLVKPSEDFVKRFNVKARTEKNMLEQAPHLAGTFTHFMPFPIQLDR